MRGMGAWGVATGLSLLSSLWLGSGLSGAASSAAPDGTHRLVQGLVGPNCSRVAPGEARIASASLMTDEILLELVPMDRLAAVSFVADWPNATRIAGRVPPSLPRTTGTAEHLLLLRADRVVLSEFNGSLPAPQLAAAGCCVAELPAPRSINDILQSIDWLGVATGTEVRASELRARLERRLARLPGAVSVQSSSTPRPRAMVLYGTVVYGSHTVQGDCLTRAGWINVAAELGIEDAPSLSFESWLALELDALFVAAPVDTPRPALRSELPSGVLWESTPVMRLGQIIAVPESWVGSLSHYAVDACEAYARSRDEVTHQPRSAKPGRTLDPEGSEAEEHL